MECRLTDRQMGERRRLILMLAAAAAAATVLHTWRMITVGLVEAGLAVL